VPVEALTATLFESVQEVFCNAAILGIAYYLGKFWLFKDLYNI
jgi:hypothetical protein